MKTKIKAHLWTLPRWFAAPFFGASLLMGSVLAGGISGYAWVGLVAGLFIMAGGHSFNSFLDYAWTGLDKGEEIERSAEKNYTGGQSIIALGIVSTREVALNAIGWYILALIPTIYLAINVTWVILPLASAGMLITFWYSKAKFNWTHELALGIGVGPIAAMIGMFSVNQNPDFVTGLLVSVPFAVILSFLGLALDEWPDAEANLKKGVKSIAYKVWQYGLSLEWYVSIWLISIYTYHVFLISIGLLKPMTGLTFFLLPILIALFVLMKANFRKVMGIIVPVAALYPILLLLGQIFGD